MTAIASTELIAELEDVVRAGSPERRIRILRQVASLFLADADRLSEHQIEIFDDVLVRLIGAVEARTLTKLSAPLADLRSAPREAVRRLAQHEDAAVAVPILRKCECLSEDDLIEVIRTRGEKHLGAIAGRSAVSRRLTDALLMRGDAAICGILARNPGAQFSVVGFATLVDMALRDDDIADALVQRPDLPRDVLCELVAKCSPSAQARLLKTAPPERHVAIRTLIEETTARGRARKPVAVDYSEAKATVLALNNAGQLNDSIVNRFAIRRDHPSVIAALSLLATVPIETIEPLLETEDCYGLVLACRASRLDWQTAVAIIRSRKGVKPASPQQLEQAKEAFDTLSLSTAQRAIRFGSVSDIGARPLSADTASVGGVH
ncbi:DUF2336 domain-containing protein [Bradyrhizobium sp. Leo121]|uniref:DUF2336 domain-containing protein n=1 Tax=Bradyrhizobium sp. Leo121 TaxID=1571195 RepID=UPI00102A79DB|nr:DUF2336 domain-containing protein [Bradyrhizobium sp. Leo121]RZN26025.1 hypothetical protein CWO90_26600 [Bradyrhizobium sp. Leo121]